MKTLFNRIAFLKEQTRAHVYARRVIKLDIARQQKESRRLLGAIMDELTERPGPVKCAGPLSLTAVKEHGRALDRLSDQYKASIFIYQQSLKDLAYIVNQERAARQEEANAKPIN